LRLGGGSRRRSGCSSSRTELRSALGEELRPSFAVRCSRRFRGLPLLAALLHDALGVRGGRHPNQDRCRQCQSNCFLHRNLPPGAGFPMIPRSRAKRQAATADLLIRLAAAFLGAAFMPAIHKDRATPRSQTALPCSSDSVVLAFLKSEALHSAGFTIRGDGVARLNPELARRVAGLVTEMCAAAHLKIKY
jgi:hypothetical protein